MWAFVGVGWVSFGLGGAGLEGDGFGGFGVVHSVVVRVDQLCWMKII